MKRYIIGLLVYFLILIVNMPAYSIQSGHIQYTVPIDFSFIDENALNKETEQLFNQYLNATDEKSKKIMLEKLLSNYSILSKINKDNPLYFVRLGIIFDKLGKDRYAKSNFCRGANIEPDYPYAYYSFGNYFYNRSEYPKALREYKRAMECGYDKNFDNIYHIALIYEKLGDYVTAIKYYKLALACKESEDIVNKIDTLEKLLEVNSLYNEKRGQRK